VELRRGRLTGEPQGQESDEGEDRAGGGQDAQHG
jgi:hypothetical protein